MLKIFQRVVPPTNVKERFGKKEEVFVLETKDKQRAKKEVSLRLVLIHAFIRFQLIMIRKFLKFDLDQSSLKLVDMRANKPRIDPGEMTFLR